MSTGKKKEERESKGAGVCAMLWFDVVLTGGHRVLCHRRHHHRALSFYSGLPIGHCARLNAQSVVGFTLGWQRILTQFHSCFNPPSAPPSVFTREDTSLTVPLTSLAWRGVV